MHRSANAAQAGRVGRANQPARSPSLLLSLIGLLALTVPVYVLVPMPDGIHKALYMAIAGGAIVLGFLGVRQHRPKRRRGWLLVLTGAAGWVFGDLVWTAEQYLLPDRYPAPSDAVYLCSYLALGAGALVFVRTRRAGRDLAALLDAAITTTSAGVLVGVFLVAPLAHDSDLSIPAKVVSSAYPLADLFLLGVLARMYAASGTHSISYRLLTASLAVMLSTDVAYDLVVLISSGVSSDSDAARWTDLGWLTGYLLLATAACVPSMRRLGEPVEDRTEPAPTRRRLAVLAGGLMLPGLALLLDGALGNAIHWPVIGVGTLLLSALVLVRMIGLLNIVQVQAIRLEALARSDSLTGAPNRRTWDQELPRAGRVSRERSSPLCVAMLDLDRFKAYNDTHGHQAGDQLLREAVVAWTAELPDDALLARYGGEEFAILIPGANAQEVAQMLHRLRAVTPGGQSFSAGVAVWDSRTDPGTAVAGADKALYTAKRAGRDRVVIHGQEPLIPTLQRPLPLFTMVTQPIVEIATSAVSSYEALARFDGLPDDADVQAVFRRAHTNGDGDLLELAAIHAALELDNRPEGYELYVNVSARALTSDRFLAGLPAYLHGVVIELSEDPDDIPLPKVAEAVNSLRGRGARIALDDVGAGAQEFARLAILRPDIIKVDRSLVAGCADDPGCTAVLSGLVTYAGQLGLTICAEGVEDIADLRHLAALGVTHAQGYLLARPGRGWPARVWIAAGAVSA